MYFFQCVTRGIVFEALRNNSHTLYVEQWMVGLPKMYLFSCSRLTTAKEPILYGTDYTRVDYVIKEINQRLLAIKDLQLLAHPRNSSWCTKFNLGPLYKV